MTEFEVLSFYSNKERFVKTIFYLIHLSLFLFSCSKSKQETHTENLVNNKVAQSQQKYFSKDIEYKCAENSSCRDEIKLIAIREGDHILRCTGVLVGNEIIFDGSCLRGKQEVDLEFCENNIEIHNLKNEIFKCSSIELAYISSESVKFYKMITNSDLSLKSKNTDGNSHVQYYVRNDKQSSEACEQSFTSLLNNKSLLINSEYLDYKKCRFNEGGIIFKSDKFLAMSQREIQKQFITAINSLCLLESCEQKAYSQKEKSIEALKASDYETVSNMIEYILSGRSVEMQDYIMLENNLKYDEGKRVFSVIPQNICRWESNVKRMMVFNINAELSLNEFSELVSDSDYFTTFLYGYNPEKLMFLEKMASNVVIPQSDQPTVFLEGRWYEAFYPAKKYDRDEFILASSEAEYGRAEEDRFVLLGAESGYKKIISAPICE